MSILELVLNELLELCSPILFLIRTESENAFFRKSAGIWHLPLAVALGEEIFGVSLVTNEAIKGIQKGKKVLFEVGLGVSLFQIGISPLTFAVTGIKIIRVSLGTSKVIWGTRNRGEVFFEVDLSMPLFLLRREQTNVCCLQDGF